MQTTDLTTKEADLNIVYGSHWRPDKPNDLNLASVKYIFTDMTDIRSHYIRLGFHLDEFDKRLGYWDFGFPTLYDFCEANLGLDKGAVSRCINVYREFNAKKDVEYIGNYESHGSAMNLSECWKDYSYTQLCELLPLTENERKQITPDMTVKQIREYKKSLKKKPAASTQPGKSERYSVASTQPENTENDPVASTQLFDFDEYENKKGIVRYNYVKKCDPIDGRRFNQLYIFDDRGREIVFDEQCDIILNDNGELVIRLFSPAKPLEWDEDDNE